MRSLAVHIVLWLCRAFDINPVEHQRLAGGQDAIDRGNRWESFYREEGGLADMIGKVRQAYFTAASEIGARDEGKLYEFVVADRMARELEREVLHIIATGKSKAERLMQAEREKAARILRAI